LKQMLDGNKDNLKLEAMKRIIGMVAKGKDASDLFPAVVKNVVSKNIEVKKLVYVYLTRYAEEQQDLALLSISTFQRALKDPNQLIRASALRVLSSIRVSMIVPIMMLAIKESVMDMSPYVRKTAAHAIPKLYNLDPEQKDILIEVIEKLLADKTTLVAGSAIQAFEEVCPDRIDLIHKNYRKLCTLLVDVEEWGQVVIINMLTRYCRTQFIDPNKAEGDENDAKTFYESSDSDENHEKETGSSAATEKRKPYVMDMDHRLLLRTCRPLLNSRNAAVVMAVAQLYHHCAPKSEVNTVAKALIRLLRSNKEVQYVVLSNIASMSVKRKDKPSTGHGFHAMFEPYLKSFYIRSSDPTHVKLLKLEILTNLATETNISTILREFQTYVTSSDKEVAASTIQAIGRCASSIAEITDACLNGLVNLLSNRNETVVGESVVVIKKLLQMQPTEHKEIISHMAKLTDSISVPMARASILWLIGEYSDRVPKIAPDVLRKMAKSFVNEEDIVKLQILNLATKLCITNHKQTHLLCQYVFNLAKYDLNYDIRDRARFLRQLVLPPEKPTLLSKYAKKIFLAQKPAPVLESRYKDLDQFQLGTLSHTISARAQGYQELPEWPEVAPDSSVRNVEVPVPWTSSTKATKTKKPQEKKTFYSSESSSADNSSASSASSSESSSSGSESGSGSESESESEDAQSSGDEANNTVKTKGEKKKKEKKSSDKEDKEEDSSSEDEDEEDSSLSSEESEESESESSSEEDKKKTSKKKQADHHDKKQAALPKSEHKSAPNKTTASDMLLDFDDIGLSMPSALGSSNLMSPLTTLNPVTLAGPVATTKPQANYNNLLGGTYVPTSTVELLNRITGGGLSVTYRFTRSISVFSPKMVSIELMFTNSADKPVEGIHITDQKLAPGMTLQDFPEISSLAAQNSTSVLLAVDFNDTIQQAQFAITTTTKKFNVNISAPVGELMRPHTINEKDFLVLQGKLGGMNDNTGSVALPGGSLSPQSLCNKIYDVANVLMVSNSEDQIYQFAAKTLASNSDVLVSVKVVQGQAQVKVNCDKMVIGSMLLKDIEASLGRS